MSIKRETLISAIISACERNDMDTYKELLNIFYQLLEQEDINDVYINEFTSYNDISEESLKLLTAAN